MVYFSEDYAQFFKDLAVNNHKDWFQANKKRYEQNVKEPFLAFVADLTEAIRQYEPEINQPAKDAVFRINRDIRFSKEKEPYKLHLAALISAKGRGNMQYPGFYFQIGLETLFGGGAYCPDKAMLQAIRQSIFQNPEAFEAILSANNFVQEFGELRGEKNKVLPKEYKALAAQHPVIANKEFYYMAEITDENLICNENLLDFVMKKYRAALSLNQFLKEAYRVAFPEA